MEEEITRRETRRSRSKTPLTLRSSVDRDITSDGEKKKAVKKPSIETIAEESPATQKSTRSKRITTKIISENNSDNILTRDTAALIANSVAVVPQAAAASEQVSSITKTTTIITKKIVSDAGKRASPIVELKSLKTTRSSNREIDQNISNDILEKNAKLRTSTPQKLNDSNNSSSNDLNIEEHPAYKEYRDAGEYWNKYPKTDYTYSKLSPHRREIKPGIVAMPNMSRRSLENHQQRVHTMIQRDPSQASFFRRRYEELASLRRRKTASDSYYDSQDETDISSYTVQTKSLLRRILIVITTLFSTVYDRTTNIFRRKSTGNYQYYSSSLIHQKKGIFQRSLDAIANVFLSVFRYIYLFISSILLLDSWLLKSSGSAGGKKKGFLLGALILLPLLLLGGTYYYTDKPAPIPNINISLDQIIDPQLIENLKLSSIDKYNTALNISSDYLLQLKVALQNSADHAHKLWSENFSN